MGTIAFLITLILLFALQFQTASQTLKPRKYPSARAAAVLVSPEASAPTDPDTIAEFIAMYGEATAARVTEWESTHFDYGAGGHWGPTYNVNSIGTVYIYVQSTYNNLDYRMTATRRMAIQRNMDFESFTLHFKEDTYIDSNRVGFVETILYGYIPAIGYADNSGVAKESFRATADIFSYSNAGGGLWLAIPEKIDTLYFKLSVAGDPGTAGELMIEYPNQVDSNFNIVGWGRITPIEDTTNGLRNDGYIRWIPPTDWKWCIPYPPHYLGAIRLRGGAGCFILRIRTVNYAVYPRLGSRSDVSSRKVLREVVASHRTGMVLSATSNTVRISPTNPINYSTDFYRGMTIEIVSGAGAGQVRNITASTSSSTPTLTVDPAWDVVPNSTSTYRITGNEVFVPGWDPANDRNGDGYVDDTEYANRVNPNASARMAWEARATEGSGWADSRATCRANLWNPDYQQITFEYYLNMFQQEGVLGYDNDDAQVLLNYNAFSVLAGGTLLEYNGRAGHDMAMNESYRDAFLQFHRRMRTEGGVQFISTNVSGRNFFLSTFTLPYLQVFNSFRCEALIWDNTSQGNLLRTWHIPAYARAGIRSTVQCHPNYGSFLSNLGNTETTWNLIKESLLARFYLLNIPDMTFFNHSWRTFVYGSGLTSSTSTSEAYYWKSGVPKNYAYLPFRMLSVDIGEPANIIPEGFVAAKYYQAVAGLGDYVIVGDTTGSVITLPEQIGLPAENRVIPIYPTYIFYLWRSSTSGPGGMPVDGVLARMYTKGLVVIRLPGISPPGGWLAYHQSTVRVPLPGTYRRVNYDGTLGPPITEITLRGYEGAILQSTEELPLQTPDIRISISADKTNPKPLDVVTVTITATNTGNAEARNVRITHDIPQGATFVRGSLKLNGDTLPDPTDTTKIDVTVTSIPAGGQAVVVFQMVIR